MVPGLGNDCAAQPAHKPWFCIVRRLWTDDDNRNLVLAHYPWFLDTFDALGTPIQRADASRLLYMHAYGGRDLSPHRLCVSMLIRQRLFA